MSSGIQCSLLILTVIGNACFAYPIEGNIFTRRDDAVFENITMNFTDLGECFGLYFCPKTSQDVLRVGDPKKGEVFLRENYYTDLCRYVQEILECGKKLNINGLPECSDEKDFLASYEKTNTNFCKSPIFPLLQGLRQCINRRYFQLDTYWKTFLTLMSSVEDNKTTNNGQSKTLFCRSYNQLLDQTLEEFQSCPDVEFQWTKKNIEIIRRDFYPVSSRKPLPFQCPDLEMEKSKN